LQRKSRSITRRRAVTSSSNMEIQPETGRESEKVGAGFAAVASAFRAWVKNQREEGEKWRRSLESSGTEMMRQMREHRASVDAQRTDLERIMREFDKAKLSRMNEREEVMFDVLTCHKQRILDEWKEPDDIWTMQAALWVETCAICRIRDGAWASHDWWVCREHEEDVEEVQKAHVGVAEHLEGWTNKGQVGLDGRCVGCDRGRMECWVRSNVKGCRFEGVVRESVAAILGTKPWFVQEWEEQKGRGRGVSWGERRVDEVRYGFTEAGRVWRTFGWLGLWDITEVGVDGFKEAYYKRFRELEESRKAQGQR
jgi:hypothetical protein